MAGDVELHDVSNALTIARNAMSFTKSNLDTLKNRLADSGYQFTSTPLQEPEANVAVHIQRLSDCRAFLPVALQAWPIEVGNVDYCGTHPAWYTSGVGQIRVLGVSR